MDVSGQMMTKRVPSPPRLGTRRGERAGRQLAMVKSTLAILVVAIVLAIAAITLVY
jgi:hypothetical protein